MTTQEKTKIALDMIRSLQFKENEKKSLIQAIMTELDVPLLDFMPEYNRQIVEVLRDSMQPVFDLLSVSQNTFVGEKQVDAAEKKVKKTKPEHKEKPVKLNKDGTPRKPYTRRQKAKEDSPSLPEPEQIKTCEEPQPSSEEQNSPSEEKATSEENVTLEENATTEQNVSENLNPPPSIAEKTEEDVQKNKRIDGKILYQSPNNPKSLMVSNEIIPNLRIWGVVVPYQNKKGVFGVSFFEEKKVMIVKKAVAKAKSFPKFFGNEWEVMNERHKKSLIAAQTKINKILEQLHGDPVHGNYLTYPFSGKENATIIRYAIELPDVNLD